MKVKCTGLGHTCHLQAGRPREVQPPLVPVHSAVKCRGACGAMRWDDPWETCGQRHGESYNAPAISLRSTQR